MDGPAEAEAPVIDEEAPAVIGAPPEVPLLWPDAALIVAAAPPADEDDEEPCSLATLSDDDDDEAGTPVVSAPTSLKA